MAHIEVRAEMAGTVKELLVSPGVHVAPSQELLILESMKMEVPIESPVSGTVVEIAVAEGAVIPEGELLIILAATK